MNPLRLSRAAAAFLIATPSPGPPYCCSIRSQRAVYTSSATR